jgi:hypothetical protein
MSTNPLQKYFRQPKLFIALPSKGVYYAPESISGDSSNMPILSMTGMDELIMKTPDALFNGEATVKVIESCCPYIKDAHSVPSLDIDSLLVAIRIATFGEKMTINHICKNCGSENQFDVDLNSVMEHYQNKTFDNKLLIDDISIIFKPLNYKEMTEFNTENFKLQKMLSQLADVEETERQQHLDAIYAKLGEIQVEIFLKSIESVNGPDFVVAEKDFIKEWLGNSPREYYSKIKDKLESNKNIWSMPKQHVKCQSCETEDHIEIAMDQTSFFV